MHNYDQRHIPFSIQLLLSFILLAAFFFAAIIFGAAETTIREVWLAVSSQVKTDKIVMIREIRVPRVLAAMLVGAGLSVAGAVMQGVTRNPLADPSLLGLTAGANAALALTIALIPGANYFSIMIACFIGSGIGTLLVVGIGSAKRGGFSPLRIVLAGAAVSAFLYAVADGIGLYFRISKDVSMWSAGGIIGTTWSQLQVIAPFIIGGIVIALLLSRQLTILSLDEEVAIGLGQNINRIKGVLFAIVVMLAGASVALVGNLAFLGLMVPHIVRAIVGKDYRHVLPMSAVVGAMFMVFADTLGRNLNAPFETSVTAIVAIMGLPFFLFIVRKGGKAFS
ncbi:iron chelate uptake ABC transporter family permease subunit [Bacillus lacus]|uniref:Iron chelate uptake ABC transporter family permease subunit n=1 Tax=Metabacillus lacus TaxID=1983721 RepID=A0A7X2LZX3_9BACI|nr:iron ABC transporter permease [Metabacillus lacus]MRX73463.1 iron chelate uptake ABC transporter family permease subunit [Metabacillus lacus]